MAKDSKIEWCHHTNNFWWGCKKVADGCDHCYAEGTSNRWGFDVWGDDKPRRYIQGAFKSIESYQELAKNANERHRVFVGSMMDIFEKPRQLIDKTGNPMDQSTGTIRERFFEMVPALDHLILLMLTKRPSNIPKMIPNSWAEEAPNNVMYGTSLASQKDIRNVEHLLKAKGRRFLSIEPQIGPITLGDLIHGIDWVIVGGESGPGKRPFDPDWARSIMDECSSAGVPFFMKQWDKIQPIPEDLMVRHFPKYHSQPIWQQGFII